MVAANRTIDSKYAVKYVGGVTAAAAAAKTMDNAGPLLLAQEHVMAVLLPNVMERDDHAPNVTTYQTDLYGLFGAGLLFHADLAQGGTHFFVGAPRWAALWSDVAADRRGRKKLPSPPLAPVPVPVPPVPAPVPAPVPVVPVPVPTIGDGVWERRLSLLVHV